MISIFRNSHSLILIVMLMLFQCFISYNRISESFVDGRLFYYAQNATTLTQASHSAHPNVNSFRQIFGSTKLKFDGSGSISSVQYSAYHPVLPNTIFRLYTKIFGYSEWVPRTFAMMFSLLSVVLVFAILFISTQSLFASWFLSLLYIFVPFNFIYQDIWHPYHMSLVFLLAGIYSFIQIKSSNRMRLGMLISLGLACLSSWVAFIPSGIIALFIYFKRNVKEFDRLHLWLLGSIGGVFLFNILMMFFLQGSIGQFFDLIGFSASSGVSGLGIWVWSLKQLAYLDFHFGQLNIALFLMLAIYIVGVKVLFKNVLAFLSLTMLMTSIVPMVVFKSYSYSNGVLQSYLVCSYIFLIGAVIINMKKKVWFGKQIQFLGMSIILPLLVFTLFNGYKGMESIRRVSFATNSDVQELKKQNGRIVYFSDGSSGPVLWWKTQPFNLYGKRVVAVDKMGVIRANDVVVILKGDRHKDLAFNYLRKRYGVKRVKKSAQSNTFGFYTVLK